jgi:hypothetical protein
MGKTHTVIDPKETSGWSPARLIGAIMKGILDPTPDLLRANPIVAAWFRRAVNKRRRQEARHVHCENHVAAANSGGGARERARRERHITSGQLNAANGLAA